MQNHSLVLCLSERISIVMVVQNCSNKNIAQQIPDTCLRFSLHLSNRGQRIFMK